MSFAAYTGIPYFYIFSHKRQDFRGKKILNKKFVFSISPQLLSENYLILRNTQPDITNVHKSSHKVTVILVLFELKLIL
jgi:hypothetical protein